MAGMTRCAVTNKKVADQLGVTHAHVSRIRSGDREPSIHLMVTIQRELNWSTDRQVASVDQGVYHEEFEKILAAYFD